VGRLVFTTGPVVVVVGWVARLLAKTPVPQTRPVLVVLRKMERQVVLESAQTAPQEILARTGLADQAVPGPPAARVARVARAEMGSSGTLRMAQEVVGAAAAVVQQRKLEATVAQPERMAGVVEVAATVGALAGTVGRVGKV